MFAKAVVNAVTDMIPPSEDPSTGKSEVSAKALLSQLNCDLFGDDTLDTLYATPQSEEARGLNATFTEGGSSSSSLGQGHRPKHYFSDTNFLGLVTRTIPANSPEFHIPKGRKAIHDEISDLRSEVVWDENSVAEWGEVLIRMAKLQCAG